MKSAIESSVMKWEGCSAISWTEICRFADLHDVSGRLEAEAGPCHVVLSRRDIRSRIKCGLFSFSASMFQNNRNSWDVRNS